MALPPEDDVKSWLPSPRKSVRVGVYGALSALGAWWGGKVIPYLDNALGHSVLVMAVGAVGFMVLDHLNSRQYERRSKKRESELAERAAADLSAEQDRLSKEMTAVMELRKEDGEQLQLLRGLLQSSGDTFKLQERAHDEAQRKCREDIESQRIGWQQSQNQASDYYWELVYGIPRQTFPPLDDLDQKYAVAEIEKILKKPLASACRAGDTVTRSLLANLLEMAGSAEHYWGQSLEFPAADSVAAIWQRFAETISNGTHDPRAELFGFLLAYSRQRYWVARIASIIGGPDDSSVADWRTTDTALWAAINPLLEVRQFHLVRERLKLHRERNGYSEEFPLSLSASRVKPEPPSPDSEAPPPTGSGA